MKIQAIEYTPKETTLEVEEITLLTADEAKKLPKSIREYRAHWWLHSPGTVSECVTYVNIYGDIDNYGIYVDYNFGAVRPVLKIKNIQFHNIGDIISIKGKRYVVISENQVLYDDEIVYNRFDTNSNDYEKSEIKQIVEKWLED